MIKPRWYYKLMYKLGRQPEYYGYFRGEELVEFCAVNLICCCLKQSNWAIYVKDWDKG